jgi:hypothetical protein
MKQAPAWSEREFETVLQNHTLSDGEVSDLLPQRTVGAVGWVRAGIHSFHTGGDVSMLSKIMLQRLDDDRRAWICPRCGHSQP